MVYFHTKNPIRIHFGGLWNSNVGIFYGYVEYFIAIGYMYVCLAIWYFLRPFYIVFQFWYVSTKKNLATLVYGIFNNNWV
jgi:hypothetical protein